MKTAIISFRLSDVELARLRAELEALKPLGVYSPAQYARKVVEDYLQGRLVRPGGHRPAPGPRSSPEAVTPF